MIKLRLLVKTCLLLVVSVNAEAQQQQQLELQEQENRNFPPTEFFVEPTRKLKFGDKKPKTANFQENAKYQNKSHRPLQQQQQQQRQQQPLAPFEIPIVQKQHSSKVDSFKGQRVSAPSVSPSHVEQPKYPTSNSQLEKRLDDAAATPRNWSRNRGEEPLNATSSKLNSLERRQRKQNAPNEAAALRSNNAGSLTARPQSRKSAITTTTKTKTTNPISIATTRSTTTTTPRPSLFPQNPFNIFSPEFWRFSSPSTTRRPPKKYTPAAGYNQASNEQKVQKARILSKAKTTTPATAPTKTASTKTISTTTPRQDSVSDGPFRIALPTLNFFNTDSQKKKNPEKDKEKRAIIAGLREKFNCPRESEVRFQLFPKICKTDEDCSVWNREELCCDIFGSKSCVSGVAKPLEEGSHSPILGLIQRKCPTRPLAELWWEVKECHTDMDCWPRVCCPDGRRRYCRTSQPELETAPVQVKRSFDYFTEYLECTPPPPPIFDLHPKACTSTFDCFPNVCCQEAGLRHCRPPKKSVLTLMANWLNVDLVKRFAENIVIK